MKKNKKSHDFLSLELYEFSNITLKEEVFPILVHIKDIKWFDFSYTIKKEDEVFQEVVDFLGKEILKKGIDRIVDCILWESTNLELDDPEFVELYEQQKKEITVDYVLLEKKRKECLEKIKFNFKMELLYGTYTDQNLKNEIMKINEDIFIIQERLISEFTNLVEGEEFMRIKYSDDAFFKNMLQMFVKSGIGRMGSTPFFPENIGRAYHDFSFREVKLRMLFENKEYTLNFKAMDMLRTYKIKI